MSVTPYIVNGQEYAVKIPVNIVESSKENSDKEKSACENVQLKFLTLLHNLRKFHIM